MTPLINGTAYSWAQVKLNILGANPAGITSVKYAAERAIQDNYGQGENPVSRSYGKRTYEASVELYMSEVEALQNSIPTGDLLDIPEFDIVVAYMPEAGQVVTHTLKNCRFKNNGREVSEGDMTIKVELNLAISHILWQ